MMERRLPTQKRSLETEVALVDALGRLLMHTPFERLSVAAIAAEASLTTGAIYRRFRDKRDLLNCCFEQFVERTIESLDNAPWQNAGLSDVEMVSMVLRATMEQTLSNIHLMRAASSVNDLASFERMREARTLTSDRMAARITTSTLEPLVLKHRCRFILRTATALFRDTFRAGHAALEGFKTSDTYLEDHNHLIDEMLKDIAAMAKPYLGI